MYKFDMMDSDYRSWSKSGVERAPVKEWYEELTLARIKDADGNATTAIPVRKAIDVCTTLETKYTEKIWLLEKEVEFLRNLKNKYRKKFGSSDFFIYLCIEFKT